MMEKRNSVERQDRRESAEAPRRRGERASDVGSIDDIVDGAVEMMQKLKD